MVDEKGKVLFRYKKNGEEIVFQLDGDPTPTQEAFLLTFIPHVIPRKRIGIFERIKIAFKKLFGRKPKLYQIHYVCPNCHAKKTEKIEKGARSHSCSKCDYVMDNVKPASPRGTDKWGNHYVAGEFKSEGEFRGRKIQKERGIEFKERGIELKERGIDLVGDVIR